MRCTRMIDDKGQPLANFANVLIALRNASELRDILAYDEMSCRSVIRDAPPGSSDPDIMRPAAYI